jgi:hypothetical protein
LPAECSSSFIAHSAFPANPDNLGQGFLARLSGSTAKFLSTWSLMMIGPTPFFVNNDTQLLEMQLMPALPSWLLQIDDDAPNSEHKHYIEFTLFTSIQVVYFTHTLHLYPSSLLHKRCKRLVWNQTKTI